MPPLLGEHNLAALLTSPFTLLTKGPFEPIFTGPLLLAITRGSPAIKEAILKPFENNLLANNRAQRLATIITTLRWLFALGLVSRANQLLSSIARNHWQLTRTNRPWKWDGETETVLITGGSSGFGYHMAKDFSRVANVVVVDVQEMPDDLRQNSKVHFYKCDLTKPDEITSTCAAIKLKHGNPSVLINNAGIGTSVTILEASQAWLEKIFRVNLLSHWQLVQEFLPGMLDAKKGHIVSIASVASYITSANMADYAATKAGLLAFHDGLNQELKHRYQPNGRSIQTTIVHPMWARTGIIKDWEATLDKETYVLPPEVVTDAIVKQVLSGKSGRVFVPESFWLTSMVNGWAIWFGELVRDGGAKLALPGRKGE